MAKKVVMAQKPFQPTSNKREHYFSNIKHTRMCPSIDDRNQTPEFWLRMNGHQTSNPKDLH